MAENIIDKNVLEMYISDMQIYAIALNRKQSVPDARDGLKTVDRRVITDMYFDKHLTYDKNYIKSAGTVGSTMEKYHPHGDCHRGTSLLYNLSGEFITIKEVYESGAPYIDILSVDTNTGRVVPAKAHSFRIGQYTDTVYHIQLSNGAEIECTSNHPILTAKYGFVKTENLVPYTRLYTNPLRLTGRPSIDNTLIQNMVVDKYCGFVPEGYHRHHKNHNYYDNRPENLEILPIQEHVRIHGHDKAALEGLALGRKEMFSEDGKFREQTKKKNSTLCQQFNKDQGLRRFKHAIGILKDKGLPITEESYETLRKSGEYYNLPYVDRLLKKYPEIGNSFNDLVNYNIPSLSDLYNQQVNTEKEDYTGCSYHTNYNAVYRYAMYKIFDAMVDSNIPLTVQNYIDCCNSVVDMEPDIIEGVIALYQYEMPYIVNIYTEAVNKEPMYDFTVDGYENMMIPVIPKYCNINNIQDLIGVTVPMICTHNSSIYDVLVKLACWWKTKIPLIEGHGNFGNMQGDGAAAMRYTESKLSEFCCDAVIADLQKSKDIVDWVPNFDESAMEPEYLPCKVPLLLINGTFGIGIGMRAEISRHNPGEVIQAVLDVIKDPEAPVVLIPDHSMPCDIVDTNWKKICNTGFGTYRCRGRVDIETTKIGRNEYQMLVIKSVPDNVTLSQSSGLEDKGIVATIDKLIKEGKLTGIKDHFDDSNGTNMRYCIVLKENTDPKYIRDFLYKHTRLEDTFRENFEVLEGIKPMRMSFKSYIEYFIQFSINMKRRTYYSLLSQAKTKWREKQLYIMVIESGEIDNIQKKIKDMKDVSIEARNEFMEYLIRKFKVTDIEAKFIMNMDQMKTAKGYLKIYKEESKQLAADVQVYLNKLTDNDISIKQEIVAELEYFKKKYNMPRVCRVVKDTGEDIPAGEFLVVVTENNKIRKMNVGTAVNSVRGDSPKFILKMDNRDNVLLYDKNGKIFKLPVHKINLCDKSMAGQDLRILIKNCTSDIITIMKESSVATLANKVRKYFLVVMTTAGCIKKMDLDDFLKVPPSGILYTKLLEGDSVKDIAIVPNSVDLVVYSHKKALRFDVETQVPHYKRSALGVSAMNSKDGVDGFSIIDKDAQSIVVITKSGKMNKFDVTGLANKKRNQAGSSVIKLGKTDMIQNILGVKETDTIKIGTSTGVVEVPVKDLSIGSSISAGQKVLNSKAGIILDSKVK